jgi:hypothetical protein
MIADLHAICPQLEEALLCQLKRGFGMTTDAAHSCQTYPNLLIGLPIARLDQLWVTVLSSVHPQINYPGQAPGRGWLSHRPPKYAYT